MSLSFPHTHCICDCVYVYFILHTVDKSSIFLNSLTVYIYINIYVYKVQLRFSFNAQAWNFLHIPSTMTGLHALSRKRYQHASKNVYTNQLKHCICYNIGRERVSKRERAAYTAYIMSSMVLRVDIHFQLYYFYFQQKYFESAASKCELFWKFRIWVSISFFSGLKISPIPFSKSIATNSTSRANKSDFFWI